MNPQRENRIHDLNLKERRRASLTFSFGSPLETSKKPREKLAPGFRTAIFSSMSIYGYTQRTKRKRDYS